MWRDPFCDLSVDGRIILKSHKIDRIIFGIHNNSVHILNELISTCIGCCVVVGFCGDNETSFSVTIVPTQEEPCNMESVVQWRYLGAVPLGLGHAATDAVVAHCGKAVSCRQHSRQISSLYEKQCVEKPFKEKAKHVCSETYVFSAGLYIPSDQGVPVANFGNSAGDRVDWWRKVYSL
jgi:hypothetical protein